MSEVFGVALLVYLLWILYQERVKIFVTIQPDYDSVLIMILQIKTKKIQLNIRFATS